MSSRVLEDEDSSVKEVEEVDIHEWKNEIHVDKSGEKGYFTKIQAAIDKAEEKTKIVIHPGIYREHLTLDKKYDIEIRSLDPEMPAIIMASNKPCITIKNMAEGHTVKLGYLRIIHRGMREEEDEKSDNDEEVSEINEQIDNLNNNNIYQHLNGSNWI